MSDPLKEYHDFFIASAGAAAALTGLLFVAISISRESTFGPGADAVRRADAERTFTAFSNAFFVSLAALLPSSALPAIAAIAALALLQTLRLVFANRRAGKLEWHEAGLISAAIYAYELQQSIALMRGDEHVALVWIVFGLYGYALGTSWKLLGAGESKPAS